MAFAAAILALINCSNLAALQPAVLPNHQSSAFQLSSGNRNVRSHCRRCVTSYLSGGVLDDKALIKPAPTYPDIAKRKRISGTVTVQVVIDINGKVLAAQVLSGPKALRRAALEAAYQALFSPSTLSGQPIKVTGVLKYDFADKGDLQ